MRFIITGAAGFIANHLAGNLLAQGHEVIGIDNLIHTYNGDVNVSEFIKCDLNDKASYAEALNHADAVYHLAADAAELRSYYTPIATTTANYIASLNLLEACLNASNPPKRFVFVSSMSVYGNATRNKPPFTEDMPPDPLDPYAISKFAFEQALRCYSERYSWFNHVILRLQSVYGPGQNLREPWRCVVSIFINRLIGNKPIVIFGAGEQKRGFTFIDDIIPVIANAGMTESFKGEIFNVGAEKRVSIMELAETLIALHGDNPGIEFLSEAPGGLYDAFCSSAKSKRLLGFEALTPLNKGLVAALEWAQKQGHQKPNLNLALELKGDLPKSWLCQ